MAKCMLRLDELPSPTTMPPLEVSAPVCEKKKQRHQQPYREADMQHSTVLGLDLPTVMPSLESRPSSLQQQQPRPPSKHDIGQCIFHAIDSSLDPPNTGEYGAMATKFNVLFNVVFLFYDRVHLETFRATVTSFQDMKATTLLDMLSTVRGTHIPRVDCAFPTMFTSSFYGFRQDMLQNAWLRVVEDEQHDLLELSNSTPPRSPRTATSSPSSPPRSARPSTR
ncbi:hypothetical protein DYB25_002056 [Aphanomyces astaci]|uniref:Uncharacterized protein n=1 Tax=Aphanomyces astaci TaxID=112090 RepID=A0A397B9U8_APHAT|nr:hypothetical protein DYB36_007269 [Aphanomyces astaci]RHY24148.1 hypothetical protein DYB25_002056 [Aphanomyces astaci]RHY40444.1 hypothetical protein DYB34_001013 [Aphanomyces astaci]RHY54660.1 hypothetical protein DYB38_003422 [Aphanomyces astaci]RHY55250.1 hypothetical protein DYB30_006139 [Aphanomyces astaci]